MEPQRNYANSKGEKNSSTGRLQRGSNLRAQRTTSWYGLNRLIGLVVKVSASREEGLGSVTAFGADLFLGRVMPVTYELASPSLRYTSMLLGRYATNKQQQQPCQAPDIIGSTLGLIDPMSVYRDWVRYKVCSATCISVRQHVHFSEEIRPRDTLRH